jgi:hypothetical protein
LDFCHSGAFLIKVLEGKDSTTLYKNLRMYDALASPMDDEKSYGLSSLGHRIFTLTLAISNISRISPLRLKEIISDKKLKDATLRDLTCWQISPFTPPIPRLTSFLSSKRQTVVDCINGQFISTDNRGETELAEWIETIDIAALLDIFN